MTLHEKLGYVPQKGVLFSGTIASNIAYSKDAMGENDIHKAAEIAQASDFIEEKEEQYDSPIAQGGTNVSGGQKQRLSIARAIAGKPEIYIFDDSFSALDYKTDAALRKALKEETAQATTIIVAQRISTILHAEQIIVLDEGRIAGIGTHKELLKSCEVYHQIAASQLSKEELDHGDNHGGRHGSRRMPNEKAKDFTGSMKKLLNYMKRYKIRFFLMLVFAVASTVFSIWGPTILGDATTEIFKGLVEKVNGTGSIDFGKVSQILIFLGCLYLLSACLNFIQGFIMTGISNDVSYSLRKDISEKINRMPMKYFESRTTGEVLSRVTNDIDTLSRA